MPRRDPIAPAGARLAALLGRAYHPGAALLLGGRALQLANSLLLSVLVVRLYGLDVLGSFALGIVPLAVLAVVGAMGLNTYLPRAQRPHGEACTAALALHAVQAPIVAGGVLGYAALMAHDAAELRVIFLVALGGYFLALATTGQMLAIMRGRYLPGLLAPVCETVALLLGATLARGPADLALALLAGRAAGAAVYWSGFRYAAVRVAEIVETARQGARYVASDAAALLADQLPPLLLALVGTRADVGLFRLAQQLLNAADTPSWTLVQARYPQMVGASAEQIAAEARRMRRLGWAAAALCVMAAWPFARYVLATPAVFPLIAVLAGSLAWRYVNCHYDYALRAAGRVREATLLGLAKLGAAAVLLAAGVQLAGVWGAVGGLALLSVLGGVVYRTVYHRVPTRPHTAAPVAP